MRHDLSVDLGSAFKGEYLDRYINVSPLARMPVFHSVGASDPLDASDLQRARLTTACRTRSRNGFRATASIRFKIKLNGGDLDADFDRVVRIDRGRHARPGGPRNRRTGSIRSTSTKAVRTSRTCSNFCAACARSTPAGFDRILYIEQPTARDLEHDRANVMHEAARLRPVVIDESLTGLEALLLAREMGYTGVALKACKGQSQAMLMAAAAQKFGMFVCVQDLTCPGASLIHSAGIAARVPGNAGIEANARQFVPSANARLGSEIPGPVHDPRRHDGDGSTHRTRARRGARLMSRTVTAARRAGQRCAWAGDDVLMRTYHDREWGVPERDPRALWEMLMLEGFQAGLAWIIVLRKRDAFRQAFAGFDPAIVARFGARDVTRLMNDAGIIRARAKIEATIGGARIFCEMRDRGEDFGALCWSFTNGQALTGAGRTFPSQTPLSAVISKELKRRGFKFVGPTIVYAWMQAVGIVNDHAIDCFRRRQVAVR